MIKLKTTKKTMREGYYYIIGIGYCDAPYLLYFQEPFAYSTRAEGWACDYYDVNRVLISTGYSYLDSKNTNKNHELTREYDKKAREIVYGNDPYEVKKEKVNKLLFEFVALMEGK